MWDKGCIQPPPQAHQPLGLAPSHSLGAGSQPPRGPQPLFPVPLANQTLSPVLAYPYSWPPIQLHQGTCGLKGYTLVKATCPPLPILFPHLGDFPLLT